MNLITILEANYLAKNKKNWYVFLSIHKRMVEQYFGWLNLVIKDDIKALYGNGTLNVDGKEYYIELYYSPFFEFRYDRIYIRDKSIKYDDRIHLYKDLSLCLYHPSIDKPKFEIIPLFKIIPWITEWIVFYNQWKKYGVWLSKEIRH